VQIRIVDDYGSCARLWAALGPPISLFDLWGIRDCFHRSYRRPIAFVVAEERGRLEGLLPVSWIEESAAWGFFPGETYHGRTWLEGNRLLSSDRDVLCKMVDALDGPVRLRYVERHSFPSGLEGITEDEIGYLFFPAAYSYSFDEYLAQFPKKSLKGIIQDVRRLEARDVRYRYDEPEDVEKLLEMNLSSFGENSYFHDSRFREGFRAVAAWLRDRGVLSVTTALIEGRIAAIDVGAVWNRNCTLLAGGVSAEFPGIAKLINFHHLRRACRHRYRSVDFLCGDFGWKDRFRLTRCPLYEFAAGRLQPRAVAS